MTLIRFMAANIIIFLDLKRLAPVLTRGAPGLVRHHNYSMTYVHVLYCERPSYTESKMANGRCLTGK